MTTQAKKIHIIINPVSGTTRKKLVAEKAKEILDPERFDIQVDFTEYAGHGFELASKAAADGVDYVVAVGGDGTVNEIGRALLNTDCAMGIIPLGSGNGLARDLHISTNLEKALSIINKEKVITMDYGKANDNIFFCTCGVGFDAQVAGKIKGLKDRGLKMYMETMTTTFFKYHPEEYEIVTPQGTIRDNFFLVTCANTGQYGYNAYIAPHADVQDGQLSISILKPLNILDTPILGLQMFSRTLDKNKKLISFKTNEITIKRASRGLMHIDGDALIMDKDIHVRIYPKGLKVLVP